MINYILQYIFPSFYVQFADVFYFSKKKLPISIKKSYGKNCTIKVGSGFTSYSLETNVDELERLSSFIQNFITNNY